MHKNSAITAHAECSLPFTLLYMAFVNVLHMYVHVWDILHVKSVILIAQVRGVLAAELHS